MKRFAEAGVRVKARHGQNFLIDLNLLQILVDSASLTRDDVVLEVGTGTGALTGLLAQRAAAVVSVEIDPQMHQLASEELYGLTNVTLLQQDALAGKHLVAPEILAAVAVHCDADLQRRFKLVANLPYNAATPLISNLLSCASPPVSMTVTIQKELGDRLAARPGTKDYSALSVWLQSQCHVRLVRTLPPSVFWPKPKVSSAIVQIDVDPALRAQIRDLAYFHDFLRTLFCHRRKVLRGVLAGSYPFLTKPDVDALLTRFGLPLDTRGEQLDPARLLALSDAVQAAER